MAPIELPVRTRNWAIERLALVTIGFWPVMVVRSPSGGVERLGIGQRLAQADVDDDLVESRGTCLGLAYSNCFWSAGTTSAV